MKGFKQMIFYTSIFHPKAQFLKIFPIIDYHAQGTFPHYSNFYHPTKTIKP